jgi:transposase
MIKKFQALQTKRQYIEGKTVIGIDPAKHKHQAVILDRTSILMQKPFAFQNSYRGYENLIKKVKQNKKEFNKDDYVFAVETSCNLWPVLCHYLYRHRFNVVLVSPLTTKHSRSLANHDFSRTDPKDALLVANNTRQGYFDFYKEYLPEQKALHSLSIAYDKLRKNYVQQKNRIHAVIDRIFPEYFNVLDLDTKKSIYLLSKYITADDFIHLDIDQEADQLKRISRQNTGRDTLKSIQELAKNSIGIPLDNAEKQAERMILNNWLLLMQAIEEQMNQVMEQMIDLAKKTPYFEILLSIKGVSEKLAALFIAETRDLSQFTHFKQVEKFAGYNLRQSQSGEYTGPRHINHIGNRRLSWILYKMTEETARHVPEVRVKFLRRQLRKRQYRKNIVASSTNLLKLIMALVRDKRPYEFLDNGNYEKLLELEKKYKQLKSMDQIRRQEAA